MINDKTDLNSCKDDFNMNACETTCDEALDKLDRLAGIALIKKEIRDLVDSLKLMKVNMSGTEPLMYRSYFIFTGNPGTGKTSVAWILADIFKNMGLLSKGHLVMKDRSGLVGQYIGETAQKTSAVIDEAMGGVLFIDEAYMLGQRDSFGHEAIDTLMKRMSNDSGEFVVIFAGYKEEMNDFLINNPGIRSHSSLILNFEDMNPDELSDVFTGLAESDKMIITPEFRVKLDSVLTAMYKNNETRNNARDVRNLFDEARKKQANRVAGLGITDSSNPALFTFEAEDLI